MTQFEEQPYTADYSYEPPRRSGLAITALVMSILGVIPCCGAIFAPIGSVLGLIGVMTIGKDPSVKGRGMAAAAIVIGVVFIFAQIAIGTWIYRTFMLPVEEGPAPALHAGFAGDHNGFRASVHGGAAAATDEEIEDFVDQLRSRYGEFISVELIAPPQQQFGQPVMPLEHRLFFTNDEVDAESDLILFDERTGRIVMKIDSIRIIDPDRGDIIFPSPAQP